MLTELDGRSTTINRRSLILGQQLLFLNGLWFVAVE
jgi:hypothetical protein